MKKLLTIIALALSIAPNSMAEGAAPATIFALQGSATIHRGSATISATEAMEVLPGDDVVVGSPGRLALKLADGSYLRLTSGTHVNFPAQEQKIGVVAGLLHFFSHSEKHPTIVTEQVTAAIRGTEFSLSADKGTTTINMLSGSVQGSSSAGTAALSGGQGARFSKGKAPEVYALLSSDRSVQWSAFIPLLESPRALGITEGSREAKALILAQNGRSIEALKQLPHEGQRVSLASVLRARILLASGDIGAGTTLLLRCIDQDNTPQVTSLAASTLALVRLIEGDVEAANSLSTKALNLTPQNASAQFARSLILQEQGDLDGALSVVQDDNIEDSTLTARRAELTFMFGDVPQARTILEGMTTRSWYADAVLGFVLMADRSFALAESAFIRAATTEPSAGLAQMGLGLIEVNRGNLQAGRSHFERATVLEPARALYRSYLAKSYFEADNYTPAEPEYARAIELDPNDPTPHLYRSFMRLAQNKPVQALEDLEKARDLSAKRSVYRSKFLLDEDSAVQSASISRVYRDLGFEQRGRIQAISAIYDDYENASAHRLLAEAQDGVFTASSSLSERRIADLFSPLSINVADSIGTSASLNEYSSLFERDGWRTGIDALYRTADDRFLTGIVSAHKNENLVTALSATGDFSDGAIENPRSNEGRVGISLQGQPTWADRFMIESRGTFFDSNQSDESNNFSSGQLSGSYLHRLSPDTTAIVQSSFRRGRDRLTRPYNDSDIFYSTTDGFLNDVYGAIFDQQMSTYESASENEAQLIDRTGIVTSVLTAQHSNYQLDGYDHSVLIQDELGFLDEAGIEFSSAAGESVVTSGAGYLATIKASEALVLNAGADYSHVSFTSAQEEPFFDGEESNSKLTPKGGIVFKPSNRIMLRVGYGQDLGRSAPGSLVSIKPTLVGGINQRYTDPRPGTISENFGTGIDLQPLKSLYVGGEWTRRWLDDPRVDALYSASFDPDTGLLTRDVLFQDRVDTNTKQDFASAYLYHIVSEELVLGTDYRFSRSNVGFPDDSKVQNHSSRTFGRYFFTNMFFVQTGGAYRHQERTNSILDIGDGTSSGWIFDTAVGYRLPTRQGFITAGVNNIFGRDFMLDQGTNFNSIIVNDPVFELAAKVNF